MSQILTDEDFANAKRDISDIDKAVNTESIVDPRWGGDFKSLPLVSKEWDAKTQDAQSAINSWQDAITQITVNDGVPALAVSTANGSNQQAVNDLGGVDYWAARSYQTNNEVRLTDGAVVISTIDNNSNNPNSDMTGWKKKNSADQIFDESGLSQQELNDKFTGARKIDLSYLKWPNGYDVSAILDASLKLSQIAPLYLILPHGTFIASQPVSTGATGKGIVLDLNGSTLKPTAGYSSPDWYFIDLQSTTEYPAVLINGVVDGASRKQNLFEYTNIADYFTDATSGVYLKAKYVAMDNVKLLNLYGQTTKFACEKVSVSNVNIDNCGGHWYVNNGYDMFGDMFYIATGGATNGVIQATFKNVTGKGKHSDQYPENHQAGSPLSQVQYSRAGLVLENFGATQNTVYVTFENCDLRFVERGVHQEIGGITSHITVRNSRIDSCVLFGAFLTDAVNGYGYNSYFGFYGSAYSGSKGLSRAYGGSSVSNVYLKSKCTVEYFGQDSCKIFGVTGNLEATDTTFKNVTGLWAESSKVKLQDCLVEVAKHFSGDYLSWASSWDIKDTKIKYTGTDNVFKNYPAQLNFSLHNVTFENIYLSSINSLNPDKFDNVSIIVNNDSTQSFKGTRWKAIKKNGEVVSYPHVLWGANEHLVKSGKFLYQIHPKQPVEALNLISPEVKKLSERASLMLIIAKGHASKAAVMNTISETAYGSGYYVAIAKRDSSVANLVKIVGSFVSVGSTAGAGYDLTINSDFDVTAYGTYANFVHVAVVPISEKDTLPFVPDSII